MSGATCTDVSDVVAVVCIAVAVYDLGTDHPDMVDTHGPYDYVVYVSLKCPG